MTDANTSLTLHPNPSSSGLIPIWVMLAASALLCVWLMNIESLDYSFSGGILIFSILNAFVQWRNQRCQAPLEVVCTPQHIQVRYYTFWQLAAKIRTYDVGELAAVVSYYQPSGLHDFGDIRTVLLPKKSYEPPIVLLIEAVQRTPQGLWGKALVADTPTTADTRTRIHHLIAVRDAGFIGKCHANEIHFLTHTD